MKVVVGEPVDESSPFLAQATLGAPRWGPHHPPHHPPRWGPHPPPHPRPIHPPPIFGPNHVHELEPGEYCAQWGCLFSWIPPVGFMNCCLNSNAPPLSRTEHWAKRSGLVATVSSLALAIWFFVWISSAENKTGPFHSYWDSN